MKPLAYLLTWTTYGTWLHGDERGWVQAGQGGVQAPDTNKLATAQQRMTEDAIILDEAQRHVVEAAIREACQHRGWQIHALNVRSNHIHVVVTADVAPERVMSQLKAWCSRRLSDHAGLPQGQGDGRRRWWTEHGSTKWINDEDYLHNAIRYVNERQ